MKVVVSGFAGPTPSTTVKSEYLLGLGGEQVSVLDGGGNWKRTNVYAAGRLIATYNSTGTHFPLLDWQGTKRVEATAGPSGVAVTEQCQSLPYGDGLDCTGTGSNHLHYTGKERDTESQNDYFGARYYASNLAGRWLTPDWSSKVEPVPYARLNDPQSLNLYAYVGDNPLSTVDPDGHSGQDCANSNNHPAQECSSNQGTSDKPEAQQQSLSAAGLQFLENQETVGGVPNLTVYDASGKKHLGDFTIGYGHKVKAGEDFSKGITAGQAADLLKADAQTAVNAVNNALTSRTSSQAQFDALVSLAYNIGGGAFQSSTLVQRLNGGGAVEQDLFTRFDRTGGAVSPGLYARREREYTLFSTGEYQ